MNKEIKLLLRELLTLSDKRLFLERISSLDIDTLADLMTEDINCILGAKVRKIESDLCRRCNHTRSKHSSKDKISDICFDLKSPISCKCAKFVSPDNLEYLEFKHQESLDNTK